MEEAIRETERRRKIQMDYNLKNGIIPKTIVKKVSDILEISNLPKDNELKNKPKSKKEIEIKISELTKAMKEAAKLLEFEHAAALRDQIEELRKKLD